MPKVTPQDNPVLVAPQERVPQSAKASGTRRRFAWRTLVVCALLSYWAPASLRAQSTHDSGRTLSTLRFEVASIRPSDPSIPQGSFWRDSPSGDVTAHAVPIISLIMAAYNVADYQVTGYPEWVGQKEFDIVAKVAPEDRSFSNNSKEQMGSRLRVLLSERFNLVVSHSTKSMTTYTLVVDRKGLKITPAAVPSMAWRYGPGWIHGDTMTMAQLSGILSTFVNGPVQDQTAVSGTYKFDLKWSLAPGTATDVPELPGALQQQLGLRLVSKRVNVETLIIDKISLPSAN